MTPGTRDQNSSLPQETTSTAAPQQAANEPQRRSCMFCKDLDELKEQGFRCVICYREPDDLIGV